MSSSVDLHPNPAISLTVGFMAGLTCSIFNSVAHRRMNRSGVVASLSTVNRFLIPGLLSGIIAAVLHGVGQTKITSADGIVYYAEVIDVSLSRSYVGQGAFQLIGICLSIGIGLFGALIIGLIIRLLRFSYREEQFDDHVLFQYDRKEKEYEEIA